MQNEQKIKEDIKGLNVLFFSVIHPLTVIICISTTFKMINGNTDKELWTSVSIGALISIPIIYLLDTIRKKRNNRIKAIYSSDDSNINNYENKKDNIIGLIALAIIIGFIFNSNIFKSNNKIIEENKKITEPIKETEVTKYSCEICRKEFSNDGYCQDENGNWRPCVDADNTIPYICSYQCAMMKKKKIDDAWDKANEKVDEYIQNNNSSQACQFCDGTGVEKSKNSMTNEYGRLCPVCKGKGVISGYTRDEMNQMRDPNNGDPEIKESAKKVFDALKHQVNKNH